MIKREIFEKITHWLGKEKILILKGARQVGKTTLLKKIEECIKEKQPQASVVYIQADKIENKNIFVSSSALELYLKQNFDFPSGYTYLIIDEFQAINQAGLFLKNVFDSNKDKMQIIVSGSSSLEITKNTEFLTGRALDFDIERINFKEYFDFVNNTDITRTPLNNFPEIESFYQVFNSRISLVFNEYLAFGGYPEVITTKNISDKEIVLESIIKRYIEKDIADFLKIENITAFNNLTKVLSDQIGNLLNKNELTNTVGISMPTIGKYIDILAGTYIFNFVKPYFKNIRSEVSKMPKIYIMDLGIKSYLEQSFGLENYFSGNVIENFVYLTLLSQFSQDYLHFYRTTAGTEIDFIIEKGNGKIIPCEVKYRSKVKIATAIKNFEKRYPEIIDSKIMITKNTLKKEGNTFFIPVALLPFIEI